MVFKKKIIKLDDKKCVSSNILLLPVLHNNNEGCIVKFQHKMEHPITYMTTSYMQSINGIGHHIYVVTKNDPLRVGDWCMFYNAVSQVLEINGLTARIKTYGTLSREDAEFVNSCKKDNVDHVELKEGDESIMVHGFSTPNLPKIIATTDTSLNKRSEFPEGIEPRLIGSPSYSFIDKFCSLNGNIDDVLVEYRAMCVETGTECSNEGDIDCTTSCSQYVLKTDKEHNHITIHQTKSVWNETELYECMQYYMEYVQKNGYITPQDWYTDHKHF